MISEALLYGAAALCSLLALGMIGYGVYQWIEIARQMYQQRQWFGFTLITVMHIMFGLVVAALVFSVLGM
jgi:uncharacterized membrane protein YcjF (UPF0283 family)